MRADPIRLRQVLTNLVGNAIKFTHNGSIEFGYNLDDKKNLSSLSRIPVSELLPTSFRLFLKVYEATVPFTQYGGSGLGLAISKGLVELLRGKMCAFEFAADSRFISPFLLYQPIRKRKNAWRTGMEGSIITGTVNYSWLPKTTNSVINSSKVF